MKCDKERRNSSANTSSWRTCIIAIQMSVTPNTPSFSCCNLLKLMFPLILMSEIITAIVGYLLVGILWGCSNPFIKHAQEDTRKHEDLDSTKMTMASSLHRLITKPRLLLPFLVNQSGSLVFYYLLSNEPVSRASPICNALTFMFTAATGYICFGEEVRYPWMLCLGIALVLFGVYTCMLD